MAFDSSMTHTPFSDKISSRVAASLKIKYLVLTVSIIS